MRGFGNVAGLMPPRRRAQPRSPEHAALGAALQRLREEAGLSQEALSDLSDVHLTHIGGLERGVRNPSYTTLLRLTKALKTHVGPLAVLADEIRDRTA
jgi:transcriptional regulator with XRE-family HTH domain